MFKYLIEGSGNTLKAVVEIWEFSQALDNSWKAPQCVCEIILMKNHLNQQWNMTEGRKREELSVRTTVSGFAVYLLIQGPEA